MNLSISITIKEYRNTLLLYVVSSYFTATRVILLIMLSFLIGIYFPLSEETLYSNALTIFPIGVLTIFFVYFLLLRFFIPFIKFKKYLKTKAYPASYSVILNKDCLQFVMNSYERQIFWCDMVSIKSFKKYLIICVLKDLSIVIPKQYFSGEKVANEFLHTIQNNLIKTRGTIRIPIFLRPPYLLGILCFFPILGVFVGIALIFLGIFQYKDRFLIGLGAIGIIFTIVLYGALFPELWNKKVHDKKYAEMSQMRLNSLIKDLELYKNQNGKYPEKLEELQNVNSIITIYDPILFGKSANSKFNYVLLGEKYKLFSSGIDKIPNTKDDIFPETNDSSKVGFIK